MRIKKSKKSAEHYVGDIAIDNAVMNNFSGGLTMCGESMEDKDFNISRIEIVGDASTHKCLKINEDKRYSDDDLLLLTGEELVLLPQKQLSRIDNPKVLDKIAKTDKNKLTLQQRIILKPYM